MQQAWASCPERPWGHRAHELAQDQSDDNPAALGSSATPWDFSSCNSVFGMNKLDNITFVMFLFIGVCGSVGATWRLRSRNESDPSL